MTRSDYLGWLGTVAVAGIAALLLLRPSAGERWYSLYGPAAIALVLAPLAGAILARRLRSAGRSPWLAALFVVPVVAAALVQIGYWTAFFALGPKSVTLALVRAVMLDALQPWLPALAAGAAVLFTWLFATAARPGPGDDHPTSRNRSLRET
jgi:uncharacterized membrane protein YhaH (DUF805 family)